MQILHFYSIKRITKNQKEFSRGKNVSPKVSKVIDSYQRKWEFFETLFYSWINDNTGDNLTHSLWDYSLLTDSDYMLHFWRINAAFDRAMLRRRNRNGFMIGYHLNESISAYGEPSGDNPIYMGTVDKFTYMWTNKSLEGERHAYFDWLMAPYTNLWWGGDSNFYVSHRNMRPFDINGYDQQPTGIYGVKTQLRTENKKGSHLNGSARWYNHMLCK